MSQSLAESIPVAVPFAGAATVREPKKLRMNFYSYDKILSFNAFWNFVVGPRGNGKTYGVKKKAIKDAITKKRQFIYVRRYQDEMKLARDSFFDDIVVEDAFPDWDFRTNGRKAEMAPRKTADDKKRPWVEIGYFVALSTAQSFKSVPFPNVWTIIYDEFILEKSGQHYLPNELGVFKNFYSTVDRNKDQVRVFFIANAITIMSPFFLGLGIKPDEMGDMGRLMPLEDGTFYIAYHFIDDKVYTAQANATKFGQFNEGTAYGAFANHSVFADAHHAMLGAKPQDAKPLLSIESRDGIFSVWVARNPLRYYVQQPRPAQELLYTLEISQVDKGKPLITYSDAQLQTLRNKFKAGKVTFDSAETRNMFAHIFDR